MSIKKFFLITSYQCVASRIGKLPGQPGLEKDRNPDLSGDLTQKQLLGRVLRENIKCQRKYL